MTGAKRLPFRRGVSRRNHIACRGVSLTLGEEDQRSRLWWGQRAVSQWREEGGNWTTVVALKLEVPDLGYEFFVEVVVQWRYMVPLLKNFGRNSVGRKMGRLRVRSCYWGKTFVFKGYSQSWWTSLRVNLRDREQNWPHEDINNMSAVLKLLPPLWHSFQITLYLP